MPFRTASRSPAAMARGVFAALLWVCRDPLWTATVPAWVPSSFMAHCTPHDLASSAAAYKARRGPPQLSIGQRGSPLLSLAHSDYQWLTMVLYNPLWLAVVLCGFAAAAGRPTVALTRGGPLRSDASRPGDVILSGVESAATGGRSRSFRG